MGIVIYWVGKVDTVSRTSDRRAEASANVRVVMVDTTANFENVMTRWRADVEVLQCRRLWWLDEDMAKLLAERVVQND
jgi:hypothetical protein